MVSSSSPRSGGIVACSGEQVLERRRPGAVGVLALHRLRELLRITQQHQALRCVRDREHVGQRQLPGLVDDQDVDGLGESRAGEQPGRAGDDVDRCRRARPRRPSAIRCTGCPARRTARARLPSARCRGRRRSRPPRLDDRAEQVADDLVAEPGDADPLSLGHQPKDHARAGPGLAGAGRPLHRQHVAVEFGGQPAQRLLGRLVRAAAARDRTTAGGPAAGRAPHAIAVVGCRRRG